MKSQTSLVAKQYRLQTWAAQIQDCQNRLEVMSVDDWCHQNNITKANYYRLRCVRQACLNSMQTAGVSFVKLQPSETPITKMIEAQISTTVVSAVLHTTQGITIVLRRGWKILLVLFVLNSIWIHMIRTHCFSFVWNVPIVLRTYYEKVTFFFSCIND